MQTSHWRVVGAAVAMIATSGAAKSQEALVIAGYGGSIEKDDAGRRSLPRSTRAHGVRVTYVAGNSTDNLAKLQAQKDNPRSTSR